MARYPWDIASIYGNPDYHPVKLTEREIRGTIILAAILLIATAAIWITAPSATDRPVDAATVLFPENPDASSDSTASIPPTAPGDDSLLLINSGKNTRDPLHSHRNAKKSKRRSTSTRRTNPGHSDRPSPLDSPLQP